MTVQSFVERRFLLSFLPQSPSSAFMWHAFHHFLLFLDISSSPSWPPFYFHLARAPRTPSPPAQSLHVRGHLLFVFLSLVYFSYHHDLPILLTLLLLRPCSRPTLVLFILTVLGKRNSRQERERKGFENKRNWLSWLLEKREGMGLGAQTDRTSSGCWWKF